MKDKTKIIYSLCIEDVQDVAMQELGRELSNAEIEKLINPIANKIPWFDVIADSINELLEKHETTIERASTASRRAIVHKTP